jgi:DNA processing protein
MSDKRETGAGRRSRTEDPGNAGPSGEPSGRCDDQQGGGDQGRGAGDGERLARAALTRVVEPGDEMVGRALKRYGAQEVTFALRREGSPPGGISEQRWSTLRARAYRVRPEADLADIEAVGGRFVCPGDHEWPGQLADLGESEPIGLWLRGGPHLRYWALRSVAVVGARACTDYGVHAAAMLSSGLAERGWSVVSGAAYGVDGAAHRGALAAGGATIGVLACGVDTAYPPGHGELIGRIGAQGLLVAELPPHEHPTRSRFVLRNRVIAALTRGTVVVEAAVRSGSLSTARHARRMNRFVMGVPGPVTSGLSAGVHELLREEAHVVTDAAEVIELVGSIGELAPPRCGATVPRDALNPGAAAVLEALPGRGALETAQLAHALGIPRNAALTRLQELCALGFVERHGGHWQLIHRS